MNLNHTVAWIDSYYYMKSVIILLYEFEKSQAAAEQQQLSNFKDRACVSRSKSEPYFSKVGICSMRWTPTKFEVTRPKMADGEVIVLSASQYWRLKFRGYQKWSILVSINYSSPPDSKMDKNINFVPKLSKFYFKGKWYFQKPSNFEVLMY